MKPIHAQHSQGETGQPDSQNTSSNGLNITLEAAGILIKNPKMGEVPCFICGDTVAVKQDKNKKLYFICPRCGLQVFVRGQEGRIAFKRIMGEVTSLSASPIKARALTTQLTKLLLQRKRTQRKQTWGIFIDHALDASQKLITSEIQKIQAEITKLNAKENRHE